MTPPRLDLRKGVTDPAVLMISRRQVEQQDLASVLDSLKVFTATREDAWLYRGQMSLVVDGYNHDPRELVDIPEVRHFLKRLAAQWPYWGFFLNQVDDSIKILGSCCCGVEFPGRGAVLIDPALLPGFLNQAFAGMNALFDQHGFPEHKLVQGQAYEADRLAALRQAAQVGIADIDAGRFKAFVSKQELRKHVQAIAAKAPTFIHQARYR